MLKCAEQALGPKAAWLVIAALAVGWCAAAAAAEPGGPASGPGGAGAPAAVGLQAVGVDVRASLRGDLDVRDMHNRPVSRALVERELAGGAAAADPTPAMSRLPMIRAVWSLLNRVLLGVGLRGGRPANGPSAVAGWPWRLSRPLARLAMILLALAVLGPQTLCLRPAPAMPASHPSRPHVLLL